MQEAFSASLIVGKRDQRLEEGEIRDLASRQEPLTLIRVSLITKERLDSRENPSVTYVASCRTIGWKATFVRVFVKNPNYRICHATLM